VYVWLFDETCDMLGDVCRESTEHWALGTGGAIGKAILISNDRVGPLSSIDSGRMTYCGRRVSVNEGNLSEMLMNAAHIPRTSLLTFCSFPLPMSTSILQLRTLSANPT